MEKITVLHFAPGADPELIEIDNDLHAMQNLVGGNIECCYPFREFELVLVDNEEGKLDGLEPNRLCPAADDVIVGDFFVCLDDMRGGFASITEKAALSAVAQLPEYDGRAYESIFRYISF